MLVDLEGLPEGVKAVMPECIMFSRGRKSVSPRLYICGMDVFAGTDWVYKSATLETRSEAWTLCDDRRAYNRLAELARLDFAARGLAAIIPDCEIIVQHALLSIFRRVDESQERGAIVQYGVAPREICGAQAREILARDRLIDVAAESVKRMRK